MSDSHENYFRWSESIDDLVGKLGCQRKTGLAVDRNHRPDGRAGFDERENCGDRVEELTTETGAPGLIPADRLLEFVRPRFCDADRPHYPPGPSFPIPRFTSSQASRCTVPAP